MRKLIIVGGNKGIGKAIVDGLKGTYEIVNICRSLHNLDPEIANYSVDILKDELPDVAGEIHGLVYCPGSIRLKPIQRLTLDDFREDLELNVIGAIKAIQKYLKPLRKGNGSVVVFSTVASQVGMPFHASIATSKSALEGLAKSLAAEFATKIRFNVIAPTLTATTLTEQLLNSEEKKNRAELRHPLKQILSPEDVGALANYLLSEKSKAISGQVFPIDAGIVSIKL